jgi:hypothetical protein
MMETFNIKRGDTSPSLLYALIPSSTVLTGATVRFSMKDHLSGAVKINRAAVTVVTATGSPTVRYDWNGTDTDTAGFYFAEFEVTYAGGAIETFPNSDFVLVQVTDDIA